MESKLVSCIVCYIKKYMRDLVSKTSVENNGSPVNTKNSKPTLRFAKQIVLPRMCSKNIPSRILFGKLYIHVVLNI